MSSSQTPPQGGAGSNDPSMEDILASIRRILSEEEPPAAAEPVHAATPAAAEPAAPPDRSDDVLVLDSSMLVPAEEEEPEAEQPPPAPVADPPLAVLAAEVSPPEGPVDSAEGLLGPAAAAAASHSVGALVRTLATERTLQVHRGGPTIEDIVREEMRPLLKQWLDANLPDLVERLVRAEIERVVHRAVP